MKSKYHKNDIFSGFKKGILGVYSLKDRRRFDLCNNLEKLQWLSQVDIIKSQNKRLAKLLMHAYLKVPYYRNIFTKNNIISRSGEILLDKFKQIPLLNRETLLGKFDSLKSTDISSRKWYYNTSGGSTGIPVKFIQDYMYAAWRDAVKMIFNRWANFSLGDKSIKLWGSERDLFVGRETLRVSARMWLQNITMLNAFLMTPSKMRNYVEIINRSKPSLIYAYVESLYELSHFIRGENLRIHSPQSIITSAGTLFPEMRRTIEDVFKSTVFNRYGTREMGDIACECEMHKGLHISPLTHYVEILNKDGSNTLPGELGEIVITCLTNYSMPLIRYRIGDMGIWQDEKCSCGRNWPLLANVSGRVTDTFIRRDGSIVSPEYLIHLIGVVLNKGWIKRFQVVQEDYSIILIKIALKVQGKDPLKLYEKEINEVTQKIKLVMGEECDVQYEFPDEILATSSGKYRYVYSKIERA